MTEVWKPVAGYEGLYEVSNIGNVKSLKGIPKLLGGWKVGRGYRSVRLWSGGKWQSLRVHRLVATAFCVKPDGCNVVNHIDNDPTNNRAENLEWVTQKDNLYHAASVWARSIRPIARMDGKTKVCYSSIREVEKDGFAASCVWNCCNGKAKSHKGYTWGYADE